MDKRQDPTQVHCYTNPSFCRQSEYIPDDGHSSSDSSDLPPPPQFQVDDLPPPPAVHQPQPQYGQTNPAFIAAPEPEHLTNNNPHHRSVANLNNTTTDRYCYIDDNVDQPSPPVNHKRYGSLPMGRQSYAYRTNRYEYIQDDTTVQIQLQRHHQQQQQQQQQQVQQQMQPQSVNRSRYEYLEQQQLQQRVAPSLTPQPAPLQQQQVVTPSNGSISARASVRSYRSADAHYTTLGPDGVEAHDAQWNEDDNRGHYAARKQISTPRGRYTSVPMQDDDPPNLPERNVHDTSTQRVNNIATQKLHEILTTPRKPRTRSQGDALSPIKSPPIHNISGSAPRNAFTPGCSPSSVVGHRTMNSPMHPQQHTTPQSRAAMSPQRSNSVKGPATSTPNKEQQPSARRCLPLNNDNGATTMLRRHIEDSQAYGVLPRHLSPGQNQRYYDEQQMPKVVYASTTEPHKKEFYQGVESAFIARTAVVPPLSPPNSETNTTFISGTEKSERKNAPIILVLVGILTCGLAIYLSYTQGRRYYYDSAIGCGACCALAGACRSMRRTWTGLGLAGLAALSCAGLLLLAAKSPKPGTPLHDVTAGALCGVSLLGAVLALLALISPRCTLGRHHRVHSWIPSFSP